MGTRLTGKVALITGAGMGMGREASILFAEEGARIVACDIDKEAADETVALVDKAGSQAVALAGGGSIILVGSVSALAGFTRAQDAYTAAKGALISLNKSRAIQFAKDRIRSNIIHPGIVETPLQAPYLTPELRAEFNSGIPLGRIGRPRDIAYAALFLASEESSFMTGAEMIVDGGFMAQ